MTIYADSLRRSDLSGIEATLDAVRTATEALNGYYEPIRKIEEMRVGPEVLDYAVPPAEVQESTAKMREVMDKATLSGVFGSDIQQATISPLPEIESAIFSPSSSAARQLNAVSEALSPVMTGERFAEVQRSLPVYDTTEISQIMDLMERVSLTFSISSAYSRSATNTETATTPSVPPVKDTSSIERDAVISPLSLAPTFFWVTKVHLRHVFQDENDKRSLVAIAGVIAYLAVKLLEYDPTLFLGAAALTIAGVVEWLIWFYILKE